jgi:hypothetical protein
VRVGDTVVVLGQQTLDGDSLGVVDRFVYARVRVKFPDGWAKEFKPEELRVIEAPMAAQGAAG